MGKKINIGLVLNGPISYSLTFIVNEIKLWEQLGFKVFFFYREKADRIPVYQPLNAYPELPLRVWSWSDVLKIITGLVKLFCCGFLPLYKFMKYELKSGTSCLDTIKKAYKVAHVLPVKLDRIHFGFGDIALCREYLAKAMDASMSISFRGADILSLPVQDSLVYAKVWANADKIHFISKDLYQQALKYGLSPQDNRVQVIYQTLDLDQIPKQQPLHIIASPVKFITVARLHPKKAILHALEVIHLLVQSGMDCHYTVVGDGEEESLIRKLISELKLEDRVYLTGALNHEEVIQHMLRSDIYIQSSVQEGFCNAVLEAQACGLLTIATDAEGIRENIVDGYTGWIVPKQDVNTMVEKIKYVFSLSVKEQEQIRRNAKKRVEQEFYLDRYKDDWELFFEGSRCYK